jgi:hypothetical protein
MKAKHWEMTTGDAEGPDEAETLRDVGTQTSFY